MNTQKEIVEAIGKLTLEITEKHPEMSKYIGEMPITNPDTEHPSITVKVLQDYYDSLKILMKRFDEEHLQSSEHQKENIGDEKL